MVASTAMRAEILPVGIVLAGGAGRRLGMADKALCLLDGETLLARVLRALGPQVTATVISANGDPVRYAGTGLPVVVDDPPGRLGPLAGLLAGMEWVAREMPAVQWVVMVPADAPFLPSDLVARLAAAAGTRGAVAVSGERLHPVVGLWPVAMAPVLREALVGDGLRRADAWVARRQAAHVSWSVAPVDPFFNVNTPEDLAEAGRLLHGGDSGRSG